MCTILRIVKPGGSTVGIQVGRISHGVESIIFGFLRQLSVEQDFGQQDHADLIHRFPYSVRTESRAFALVGQLTSFRSDPVLFL